MFVSLGVTQIKQTTLLNHAAKIRNTSSICRSRPQLFLLAFMILFRSPCITLVIQDILPQNLALETKYQRCFGGGDLHTCRLSQSSSWSAYKHTKQKDVVLAIAIYINIYFLNSKKPKTSRKALGWNNVCMSNIKMIYQSNFSQSRVPCF